MVYALKSGESVLKNPSSVTGYEVQWRRGTKI